jgi:hypothetical protein
MARWHREKDVQAAIRPRRTPMAPPARRTCSRPSRSPRARTRRRRSGRSSISRGSLRQGVARLPCRGRAHAVTRAIALPAGGLHGQPACALADPHLRAPRHERAARHHLHVVHRGERPPGAPRSPAGAPGAARASCPSLILPNAEGRGYFLWSLPGPALRELAGAPGLTDAERLSLSQSLVAAYRAAAIPAVDVLSALGGLIRDREPAFRSITLNGSDNRLVEAPLPGDAVEVNRSRPRGEGVELNAERADGKGVCGYHHGEGEPGTIVGGGQEM